MSANLSKNSIEKVLVFNASSFLGRELAFFLRGEGHDVFAADVKPMDFSEIYQYKANSYSKAFVEDCVRATLPSKIVIAPMDEFVDISSSIKSTLTIISALADIPKYSTYKIFNLSSMDSITVGYPSPRTMVLSLEEELASNFSDFLTIRLPLVFGPRKSYKDDFINSAVHKILLGEEVHTFSRKSSIVLVPLGGALEVIRGLLVSDFSELSVNVEGQVYQLGNILDSIVKTIGHGRIIYDDTQLLESPVYAGSFHTIRVKSKVTKKQIAEIIERRKSQLVKMGYTET